MIWGNAWRVTGSPKSSPKSDRLSGGKQTAGSENRGNTPGGKDDGGRKRGRAMGGACPRVPW